MLDNQKLKSSTILTCTGSFWHWLISWNLDNLYCAHNQFFFFSQGRTMAKSQKVMIWIWDVLPSYNFISILFCQWTSFLCLFPSLQPDNDMQWSSLTPKPKFIIYVTCVTVVWNVPPSSLNTILRSWCVTFIRNNLVHGNDFWFDSEVVGLCLMKYWATLTKYYLCKERFPFIFFLQFSLKFYVEV